MQFGIFSVSDITRDPVTNYTPSEAERIDAIVKIAQKTEEVGMDVFAIGEHHNPPFFSSSPTTLLAYIAWNRGVEVIGAPRASVFLHTIPLFAAVFATSLLGERLYPFHVVGFVLILAGVSLAARPSAKLTPTP